MTLLWGQEPESSRLSRELLSLSLGLACSSSSASVPRPEPETEALSLTARGELGLANKLTRRAQVLPVQPQMSLQPTNAST